VVYLNENLEIIAPVQGYMTPEQIEPILKYIGEGHYKTKDYQAFMGTFKGHWTAP
jgi:thioredoxin-related protein